MITLTEKNIMIKFKSQKHFNVTMPNSFIFYDYETFGTHVALDKVAQFCCITTDNHFNIIKKKIVFFCYPPLDYLPDPKAILITKILPQHTILNGYNEYFFSKKIYKIFSKKNICITGYNNINFDNMITRNLFYRNLLDPYEWSWKNGNSTWDILNILRAFYVFFPKTMNWFYNLNQTVSFKLSDVTRINNIMHTAIHEASSDVLATISVVQLLYRKNKNFLLYLYYISQKKNIFLFLSKNYNKPIFYLSSYFSSKKNNFGCVMILGFHPKYQNNIIIIDLSRNLKKLFALYQSFLKNECKIIEVFGYGVYNVCLNKSPLFFSYNAISIKNCVRLKINYMKCQKNFFLLKNNINFKNWIFSCFSRSRLISQDNHDIDLMLYKSFFSYYDKQLFFSFIHNNEPKNWINLNLNFKDSRIKKIFFRLKARNFLYLLNDNEKKKWQLHCQNKLNDCLITKYIKNVQNLNKIGKYNEYNCFLLTQLIEYVKNVVYQINILI